jgi:DNA-binding NtrC family response regulator
MSNYPIPDWREHGANRKLMLFESFEHNICERLASMFESAGFRTQQVSTVRACLDAVQMWIPDAVLIITNNMTEEPAFEVAKAIRAIHPNCGFVFVAGGEEQGRQKFVSAGYKFRVQLIPMPFRELTGMIVDAMDSPLDTFVVPQQ